MESDARNESLASIDESSEQIKTSDGGNSRRLDIDVGTEQIVTWKKILRMMSL